LFFLVVLITLGSQFGSASSNGIPYRPLAMSVHAASPCFNHMTIQRIL